MTNTNEAAFELLENDMIYIPKALAEKYGVRKAAILQHVHFWTQLKEKKSEQYKKSFHEGRYWVFNSMKNFHEREFSCFGTVRVITKDFNDLVKSGILIRKNFNRLGFDKTGWFAINYNALELDFGKSGIIQDTPGSTSRYSGQYVAHTQISSTIPETSSETSSLTSLKKECANSVYTDNIETKIPTSDLPLPTMLLNKEIKVEPADPVGPEFPMMNIKQDPDKRPYAKPAESKKYSADFERFWAVYPIKRGKFKSSQQFKRLKLSADMQSEIIKNVELRIKTDKSWIAGYGVHPLTYLNGRLWEDEFEAGATETALGLVPVNQKSTGDFELDKRRRNQANLLKMMNAPTAEIDPAVQCRNQIKSTQEKGN